MISIANDVIDCYNSIINDQSKKNWIWLCHKGLNVTIFSSGEEGLEEMLEDLDESRVLYGFARVIDSNTNLPKFAFISWCPDGAPANEKGSFNTNVQAVSRFLKGYHIQINARDLSDLSESIILKKIQDSSGAKYSVQQSEKYIHPVIVKKEAPSNNDAIEKEKKSGNPPISHPIQSTVKEVNSWNPFQKDISEAKIPIQIKQLDTQATSNHSPKVNWVKSKVNENPKQFINTFASEQNVENRGMMKVKSNEWQDKRSSMGTLEQKNEDQKSTQGIIKTDETPEEPTNTTFFSESLPNYRALYDYEALDDGELSLSAGQIIKNVHVSEAEGWIYGEIGDTQGLFPATYAEPIVTYVALYDYQGADGTELSFLEGEEIYDVIQQDEEWLYGTSRDGKQGHFPASYASKKQ